MKVALLTPAWPGDHVANGIATYVANLAPALSARGLEVFVVAAETSARDEDGRVHVYEVAPEPMPLRAFGRLCDALTGGLHSERLPAQAIVRAIRRLEREHGIDIVEMEESFGWCGWVAARCPTPVVARLHGPWFLNGAGSDPHTRSFRRRVRREGQALARVHGISAPSRYVLEQTRSYYGTPLDEAVVVPNPLQPASDEDRWDPSACDPRTILFVGRFDLHKGGDLAIEAFARIRAAVPDARLVFAGPDVGLTDGDGRRWQIPEFVADRLPRAEDRAALQWLGRQPAAAVRRLRREAAVTVVCSRWEVFGYTLAEAMGQGCPVVATATGGLLDLVRNGENGLLARSADADDLARAVVTLLRDPRGAAELGRRAYESASQMLAPPTIADQTIAHYRSVLAQDVRR